MPSGGHRYSLSLVAVAPRSSGLVSPSRVGLASRVPPPPPLFGASLVLLSSHRLARSGPTLPCGRSSFSVSMRSFRRDFVSGPSRAQQEPKLNADSGWPAILLLRFASHCGCRFAPYFLIEPERAPLGPPLSGPSNTGGLRLWFGKPPTLLFFLQVCRALNAAFGRRCLGANPLPSPRCRRICVPRLGVFGRVSPDLLRSSGDIASLPRRYFFLLFL